MRFFFPYAPCLGLLPGRRACPPRIFAKLEKFVLTSAKRADIINIVLNGMRM